MLAGWGQAAVSLAWRRAVLREQAGQQRTGELTECLLPWKQGSVRREQAQPRSCQEEEIWHFKQLRFPAF
jgi:hypothetical protein